MNDNFWQEQFDGHPGAEGIDFVSLMARPWKPGTIYDTKTKEQMLAGCAYPRSNYLFWKMENGKKVYIYGERDKIEPGSLPYHPEHRQLWALKDWGEDKIVGIFESQETAEEMCVSYTEEAAYIEALELYQWNHHWDMERACTAAWKRHVLDFWIEPVDCWSFLPF